LRRLDSSEQNVFPDILPENPRKSGYFGSDLSEADQVPWGGVGAVTSAHN